MREIEVDNDMEIMDNGQDVAIALNVIFVNFGTWQPQSLLAGDASWDDYIYSSRALWSTWSMH